MGKWLLSQILAFLGWTLAALFRLVDYLTYDMVSGKSWVKPFAAGAAPSATEAERPAMPPHKVDPVTHDRPLAFIITLDFSKLRLDPDIDAICKEIEEGKK